MTIMMIRAFMIFAHFMTTRTHIFRTAIRTFYILASAGFALGLFLSFLFGHISSYVHIMNDKLMRVTALSGGFGRCKSVTRLRQGQRNLNYSTPCSWRER